MKRFEKNRNMITSGGTTGCHPILKTRHAGGKLSLLRAHIHGTNQRMAELQNLKLAVKLCLQHEF